MKTLTANGQFIQAKLSKEQRAWLDALRSGEYVQGSSRLCNNDQSMCCLGVLCDVVDPDGWMVIQTATPWLHSGNTDIHYAFGDQDITTPPKWVQQLVGIDLRNVVGDLVNLNDARCWTFKQIADWLEHYWLTGAKR